MTPLNERIKSSERDLQTKTRDLELFKAQYEALQAQANRDATELARLSPIEAELTSLKHKMSATDQESSKLLAEKEEQVNNLTSQLALKISEIESWESTSNALAESFDNAVQGETAAFEKKLQVAQEAVEAKQRDVDDAQTN